MDVQITAKSKGDIRIIGEATVHCASELYCGLATVSHDATSSIRLCLDEIDSIDTAGAQILISFIRSMPPGQVTVTGGDRIRDRLRHAGLESFVYSG